MIKSTWIKIQILLGLIVFFALVHIGNSVSDGHLNQYGIVPRELGTWFHVFSAPFIHASNSHLMNNLFGFGVFSALCMIRSIRFYLVASLFIIVCTGLLIWLFGRTGSHIGASGWIFGLWSLSIAMAWFDRSIKSILIATVVIFYYGGMVYGVLPSQPGVSFEAHLFGAIAGFLYAMIVTNVSSNLRWMQKLKINKRS